MLTRAAKLSSPAGKTLTAKPTPGENATDKENAKLNSACSNSLSTQPTSQSGVPTAPSFAPSIRVLPARACIADPLRMQEKSRKDPTVLVALKERHTQAPTQLESLEPETAQATNVEDILASFSDLTETIEAMGNTPLVAKALEQLLAVQARAAAMTTQICALQAQTQANTEELSALRTLLSAPKKPNTLSFATAAMIPPAPGTFPGVKRQRKAASASAPPRPKSPELYQRPSVYSS